LRFDEMPTILPIRVMHAYEIAPLDLHRAKQIQAAVQHSLAPVAALVHLKLS
jgi:hypothetical protein